MTRKSKTKTTTKKQIIITPEIISEVAVMHTSRDMTTALLVVSLTINLFILTGWVTLQVTSAYDAQVANFLFTR